MKRLIVSVLLVGCGGDNGGSFVELDDLGTELALASCGKQFECCSDAEIMAEYMGITYEGQPITTVDQCVAFTSAVFTSFGVTKYKEGIALGRMEYDGAAAGGCVAAIDDLSCAAYSTGQINEQGPSCRPFVIPKVADGGACTQDHECLSGNCEGAENPISGPSTDGMCKPVPTAGQACEDNCASGLYCGSSTGGDTCQATKAEGMQCNFDDECITDNCEMRMCAVKMPTCDGR